MAQDNDIRLHLRNTEGSQDGHNAVTSHIRPRYATRLPAPDIQSRTAAPAAARVAVEQ